MRREEKKLWERSWERINSEFPMSQFLLNAFKKKYLDLKENINKLYKDMLNRN